MSILSFRNICSILLATFCLLTISMSPVSRSYGQGFLKVKDGKIVNAGGENVLLRGMGLGGWMLQEGYMLQVQGIGQQQHSIRENLEKLTGKKNTNAFYDAWLINHTTRKDIEAMKSWGFNSVRLPMHYNLYTLPVEEEKIKGQNTWLKKGFELTDSLLAWCRDNEIYLILDLHAAPGGQGHDLNISDGETSKPFLWDSPANQQKTVALWKELANRYKNETWIGAYDIINEPNWGFEDPADINGLKEKGNKPLRKLMMDITTAIRSVDQQHIIIIEGNGWGNNYAGILPPWDDNMVLSFHKYWNFNDQGSIQQFIDYREKYNIPIWLGESGENSNTWFTQAISLMEANNIGWCWWPLKKIGNNNPLEISSNPEYDKILAYWRNEGPKPDAETATKGMMMLAASTNFSKNLIHKDVIDAMFRQINSTETIAFTPNLVMPGYVLPAVAYDFGRNGYAYFDNDSADYHISNGKWGGNHGRKFRNDGVDIEKLSEGYAVSHIEDNEWLQYNIDVVESGKYRLYSTILSKNGGGELIISIKESDVLEKVVISGTGGAETWQQVPTGTITLEKGKHKLQIKFPKGGFSLRDIRFEKAE